ncbi:aminoglycoside phosphotransferase family protein [Streptomyces candidus]|uniref:Streptomycin 6-kinase n=1 Tax=Streptomyces candidus TaxID=67283 RepID=A0A7X0HIQ1_9ACTN|nr:aminoglycoside phosphotransferase family protein [Streptomyces candidus]MBB6438415.1 streptomycin 6-kinase [Streptomyces candidus]GHH52351.1 kinase [Streptomyces candidus]
MAFEPSQRLVRALAEAQGESAAADWLERLPSLAQEAIDGRELTVERVQAPGGRSSMVVLVRRPDGTQGALKLAPEAAHPERERAALAHWNGWGAVQLAEVESPDGALLLERLHCEVSLRSLPEAKALLEAADLVRKLWVAPAEGHPFETVEERTGRQSGPMREAPQELTPLVDAALAARDSLVASSPELLLLHGNFRQGKVLGGDRTPWLAVGPDPLVGERAYDLARLVRDRIDDQIATAAGSPATRRRINRLADSLDVDRERLHGWTLFRAVESGTRALAAGRTQDGEMLLEFASWL